MHEKVWVSLSFKSFSSVDLNKKEPKHSNNQRKKEKRNKKKNAYKFFLKKKY